MGACSIQAARLLSLTRGVLMSIGLGYAEGQLLRAYMAALGAVDPVARGRAIGRVAKWRILQEGIAAGLLQPGSRTPVNGVPAWVTIEVLHGGFATGSLVAEAPLTPEERTLAEELGAPIEEERSTLNQHYLSPTGRAELLGALQMGRIVVDVPEHAALVVVAWLLETHQQERALNLIEALAPFFGRLRFWPGFGAPATHGDQLQLRTVAEVSQALRGKETPPQIARLFSRYETWNPLYDALVAWLWQRGQTGMALQGLSQPLRAELRGLLQTVAQARETDPLGEPGPKSNFQRLLPVLQHLNQEGSLRGSQVQHLWRCLNSYIGKFGVPGGERIVALRTQQRAFLRQPRLHELREALAARLELGLPENFEDLGRAIHLPGHPRLSTPVPLPASLHNKLKACRPGTLEQLMEWGVLPSSEAMSALIPVLVAGALASDVSDPQAKSLLALSHRAFARRRSLLLVNLASQVGLHELPWVAALLPKQAPSDVSAQTAGRLCDRVVGLSLKHFPEQPLSNPFVRQLQGLRVQAGLPRLVQELAADIFQGRYASHFMAAAQRSCGGLRSTVYDRYYALPSAADLTGSFDAVCRRRCPEGALGVVAKNGQNIEQALILTSHNLWDLWHAGTLGVTLAPELDGMARRCFLIGLQAICGASPNESVALERKRRAAAVWRQMLFFLSVPGAPEAADFAAWCSSQASKAVSTPHYARFKPFLFGLVDVLRGRCLALTPRHGEGRRLLGWGRW